MRVDDKLVMRIVTGDGDGRGDEGIAVLLEGGRQIVAAETEGREMFEGTASSAGK